MADPNDNETNDEPEKNSDSDDASCSTNDLVFLLVSSLVSSLISSLISSLVSFLVSSLAMADPNDNEKTDKPEKNSDSDDASCSTNDLVSLLVSSSVIAESDNNEEVDDRSDEVRVVSRYSWVIDENV